MPSKTYPTPAGSTSWTPPARCARTSPTTSAAAREMLLTQRRRRAERSRPPPAPCRCWPAARTPACAASRRACAPFARRPTRSRRTNASTTNGPGSSRRSHAPWTPSRPSEPLVRRDEPPLWRDPEGGDAVGRHEDPAVGDDHVPVLAARAEVGGGAAPERLERRPVERVEHRVRRREAGLRHHRRRAVRVLVEHPHDGVRAAVVA